MGFYLGTYGFTQVFGMVVMFPRLSQYVGLMYSGVIGCFIFGLAFFTIFTTKSPNDMFAVCIPMAFGNSLCRPVFPSYLGSIASKDRRAEYMAITATFSNVALMIGGQMTYLYTTFSPEVTIFLCGGASILNGIMLLIFAWFHPEASKVNK
jgi:MFS-type transporter involved in bile tolerance (Atg22 family)